MSDSDPNSPYDIVRKHARHEARLQVSFLDPRAFPEQCTVDISEGGLFVNEHGSLMSEDTITVDISLPGEPVYSVPCRVAHASGGATGRRGTGLEFLTKPPGFQAALTAYLQGITGR